MFLKCNGTLGPLKSWLTRNGSGARIAYPGLLAINRTFTHHSLDDYYERIVKESNELCKGLKYTTVTNILTKFISSKYDAAVLKEIYSSSSKDPDSVTEIDSYVTVLQVCKTLKVHDFDLISSLSENIRLCLLRNFGKHGDSNNEGTLERLHADAKPIIFAICTLYNDLGILYDPLFLAISNLLYKEVIALGWKDIELLLSTYANQKYNDVRIIGRIVKRLLEEDLADVPPDLAVSFYSSLSLLECLSADMKLKLEGRFVTREDSGFHRDLSIHQLADIAYSNLLLNLPTDSDLKLITACLARTAEMLTMNDPKFARKVTIILSFLKCMYPNYYNDLSDDQKNALMALVLSFDEYKSTHSTVFVDKVSAHLYRMKIRHESNIYKNGLLLDIVEQDRNLVWLCNSYHRFYATTFNFTAEHKLVIKLIKAFGYKLCLINYYQWGRMKCKRTRFAFLRMARYYALHDKREYDQQYAGWSLPYVWWNSKGRDQAHISLYEPNVP